MFVVQKVSAPSHATPQYIVAMLLFCWAKLRRITRKQWILAGGTTIGVILLFHLVSFLWPRGVHLSYAAPACFTNPVFLPRQHDAIANRTYSISSPASISLGSYPLYSFKSCIHALQVPEQEKSHTLTLKLFGLPLLHKSVKVSAAPYPKLHSPLPTGLVSTKEPLTFRLDIDDKLFSYSLRTNGKTAVCHVENALMSCDVPSMKLDQGATYPLDLVRAFQGKDVDTLFTQTITTISPVEVVSTSITEGSTVYDKPATITLKLNKPIKPPDSVQLNQLTADNKEQPLGVTLSANGDQLTITFQEALPRSANFRLVIPEIIAADNSFLPKPYILNFKTSGGPKVTAINIGTYGIATTQRFTLTFDSNVSEKQLSSAILLEVSGARVSAALSISGNRVTITPASPLPRCTTFVVRVTNGLENIYGIAGGSAWQLSSRTICHTTETIGASLNGRGITAYRFGSGASKIIYFGGLHGNEQSSKYILDSWIDDLERNFHRIPANRTIIVIPNTNPDGIAASNRLNARGVDLNRNFPANDWKQDVTVPGGTLVPNGGGTAPLSEPESSSLANYILAQGPRLVMSYHADAAIVIANDAGDSRSLATVYGQKSRLFATGNSDAGGVFAYDTTGALENWLYDKHSIPNILVELSTARSYEFSRHQSAMWYIAELP